MELFFLGTGAGLPSNTRNVTCCVLNLMQERGSLWVFDCGEATQQQFLRSPLKTSKIEKIFITHLHGDHLFGLPGLLSSKSFANTDTQLVIYGPKGIKEYLEVVLRISTSRITYPLEVIEIKAGTIFEDEQFIASCLPLEHRVESFGFRVVEKDKQGALNSVLLSELNIPSGPHLKLLKEGKDIVLEDGRTICSKTLLTEPIKGKVITIFGDTIPTANSIQLADHADVMVHEATFEIALEEAAIKFGHSTTEQVAKIAKAAKVKKLIITHISARYVEKDLERLLNECRAIFPSTQVANDFSCFVV